MRSVNYGSDALSGGRRRRQVPEIAAETGLVVEDATSGFCGAVVRLERGNSTKHNVILEDRHGRHRTFPMRPAAFLYEGAVATLVAPASTGTRPSGPKRSASGSVALQSARARTARESRIWVEGLHDAELIERVWGHDLRVEGVVVEPLHGVDDLPAMLAEFGPAPHRHVGVLVDHLVTGSKEARIVEDVDDPHVLVTGHPFVDIWEAVKPERVGITEWPRIARGTDWKTGVCTELGWGAPAQGWRTVLAAVSSFRDLQTPLISAMERLIDFVTEPPE